jgi:L-lactate utilization protein LutC
MLHGREAILGGIRTALGREGACVAPEALPRFSCDAPFAPDEDIVGRFCEEVERVGGRVARVESGEEIREYLGRLLSLEANPVVAVTDDAAVESSGVREWLAGSGARLVPTLREFVSHASNTSTAGNADDVRPSADEYKRALLRAHVGVTSAEYAIAETGTLVLVSGSSQQRLISLLPPVHVCLLNPSRIKAGMGDLLARVRAEFDPGPTPPQAMTFITGPSCTADIEQTLVRGMHGPRELHVLLSPSAR